MKRSSPTDMARTPLTNIVPRIQFAWWETMLMRFGFALLLLGRFPPLAALPALDAEMRFPNGLAKWIDMSWVLDPTGYSVLVILLHIALVLYVTGFAFPLSST
ncbi:MAG TPA: hypothetical protein VFS35_00705, partial [Terrimicrobiaceae bacterium]|nr:hypothetical protein [Terrimicrobiaceae bacterium]